MWFGEALLKLAIVSALTENWLILPSKSDIGISTQSQTLDEVIPKINDFSQNIVQHILGTTPQSSAPPVATAPVPATTSQVPSALSRESQIIAKMKARR